MASAINTDTSMATTALSAADYMKKSTGLNKDDFMKLFVTQLRYQDPLKPQDSSTMVAQMAQLTQVEQAYNTNKNLESLLGAANGTSSLAAVSFIGKTITAQGSTVNLTQGKATRLDFTLDHAAEQLQVAVKDSGGRTVRTMTAAATAAGEKFMPWDGLGDGGMTLPAGRYTFSVTGVNRDGSTFAGTPLFKGIVDGVKLDQGKPVLSTGGVEVPLASVMMVTG